METAYQKDHSHTFVEVNKNSALTNMNDVKQQAKKEGVTGTNDVELSDSFNNKQTTTGQTLKNEEQRMTQEYSAKQSQHKERANKNLTGLAVKHGLKHVADLAEVGSNFINAIKGEKQSE